jgi:hypothetical protein
VCTGITIAGGTMTGWYELLDAAGRRQSAFDAATTAALHSVTDLSATLTSTASTGVSMVQHSDMTLGGLLTGTHTLSGTSNSTTSFNSGGATTTITGMQAVQNLVLATGTSAGQWPQSGSIAMSLNFGDGSGAAMQSTLTFNGTSIATMTTTSFGTTRTCTIDLANPTALGSCH